MSKRRVTKPVYVGGVKIGGGADVTVQSMTKTDTRDVKATVKQIHELEEAGCEVIRSAVPDADAAEAMGEIKDLPPPPSSGEAILCCTAIGPPPRAPGSRSIPTSFGGR